MNRYCVVGHYDKDIFLGLKHKIAVFDTYKEAERFLLELFHLSFFNKYQKITIEME